MSADEMSEFSIEKCDIFDFMAKYVGLSVLHPGGFSATKTLADELEIDKKGNIWLLERIPDKETPEFPSHSHGIKIIKWFKK